MANDWTNILTDLGACEDAVAWADTQPAYATAWRTCERGDWMLWVAERRGVEGTVLVRAACDCAALALPVWEAYASDDRRPHEAIETARRWAAGGATVEDVTRVWTAVRAAFVAVVHSPARVAATAAAFVATATADATAAAFAATAAADATAARVADAAIATDTRALTHRQCADIVRHYITEAP